MTMLYKLLEESITVQQGLRRDQFIAGVEMTKVKWAQEIFIMSIGNKTKKRSKKKPMNQLNQSKRNKIGIKLDIFPDLFLCQTYQNQIQKKVIFLNQLKNKYHRQLQMDSTVMLQQAKLMKYIPGDLEKTMYQVIVKMITNANPILSIPGCLKINMFIRQPVVQIL